MIKQSISPSKPSVIDINFLEPEACVCELESPTNNINFLIRKYADRQT